jgi:hypothetical protein
VGCDMIFLLFVFAFISCEMFSEAFECIRMLLGTVHFSDCVRMSLWKSWTKLPQPEDNLSSPMYVFDCNTINSIDIAVKICAFSYRYWSRDRSVRMTGVRFPTGVRFFCTQQLPDRLWDIPSLPFIGYWGPFSGGEAAGA